MALDFDVENTPPAKTGLRRALYISLGLIGLLVLLAVVLRVFMTLPIGHRFIENQVNSRTLGPIESVNMTGLSGDPLSGFSIDDIKVYDKDGLWFSAGDVTLRWHPLSLLKSHANIDTLSVKRMSVLRRPSLNAGAPRTAPLKIKVTAKDVQIPTLVLEDPILGTAMSLSVDGGFQSEKSGALFAKLNATRTDIESPSARESVSLDFKRTASGELSGDFELFASQSGPIAALLRAPEGRDISGTGTLSGGLATGTGQFSLNFGDQEAVDATTFWDTDLLSLTVEFPAKDWALLAPLQRLNAVPKLDLKLTRSDQAQPFTLSAIAGQLALHATGILPPTGSGTGFTPEDTDIVLTLSDPSVLSEWPAEFALSDLRLEGKVLNLEAPEFIGQYFGSDLKTPSATASTLSGPLTVSYSKEKIITFNTRADFEGLNVTQDFPLALSAKAQVHLDGVYNLPTKSLTLSTGKLISGSQKLSVQGRAGLDPLTYNLTGTTALLTQAIGQGQGQVPSGQLRSDFKIIKTKSPWPSVTADGAFRPSSDFGEPLGSLIGEQLLFDIALHSQEGGLSLTKGRLRADGFMAEASGQIGEALNIALEGQLSTDLIYQEARLSENTQLSGHMTGTLENPAIKIDATSPSFAYKDIEFTQPRLRAEFDNVRTAPQGQVRLTAGSEYGDLDVSAKLSSTANTLKIENFSSQLGTFSVKGALEIPEDKIVTGTLTLDLPKDGDRYANADLTFERREAEQGLIIKANAQSIAYKTYEIDSFTLSGAGTFEAFTGQLSTAGQDGSGFIKTPFRLDTPLTLTRGADNVIKAIFSPDADYGRTPLRAATPLTLSYADKVPEINGSFDIKGGTLELAYLGGEAERLSIKAGNIPVRALPLPSALAETHGRVALQAEFAVSNGALDGNLRASISDWRGRERDPSETIDLKLESQLSNQGLSWTLNGASPLQFVLNGKGTFPVTENGTIASIRPDMSRSITGNLRADGAAAAIFGLITPSDADLDGTLSARLDLSGTLNAPQVQGEITGKALQLEVPQSGTRVRNGRFAAQFTNHTLTVSELFAEDPKKGVLQGHGDFKLGEFGRPLGVLKMTVTGFQALDRQDLSTRLSGGLTVHVKEKTTEVGGDIKILELELTQFVTGTASVIEIDVIEINAPTKVMEIKEKAPSFPVNLTLNVTAPRKIFVRSQGLDVELSLEARISGTIRDPQIHGEAEVLRGGYTIAGKELEFESGLVVFDGDIAQGKIDFKATTDTQNLEAVVEITGTVEKPEITLSSTPERPQDEILSAILFGSSATELSTIEAAQLAGALAQFSGSGGFDLLGGFRDALGVGQLSLGVGEDGGAMLTGGRYLAKNVYLQIYSGVRANNSGAVIDWEVRKNLSLRSRLQSDNAQSLSLKWKRDF